jgi:hypothetical protein
MFRGPPETVSLVSEDGIRSSKGRFDDEAAST